MFSRKLVVAGIAAFALTPGVAMACMGSGSGGGAVSSGATGTTGVTSSTTSSDPKYVSSTRYAANTSGYRHHHFRHGHQSHGRRFAGRS
jgi:hypothetical protein